MVHLTEQEQSHRMRAVSVIAMIAVVIIHTNSIGTLPELAKWNAVFQELFSRIGTSWAVPFFFIQAGYWAQKGAYKGYVPLLKKKFWGLLIPYLLWAVIGTCLCLPLIMGNNYLTGLPLLERTIFAGDGLWAMVNAGLGIGRLGPMGNLALWFVRSLMVLFLFFPIFKWSVERLKFLVLLPSLACMLIFPETLVPYLVTLGSVGYFLLGMVLAKMDWGNIKFSVKSFAVISVAWIMLLMGGGLFVLPRVVSSLIPLVGVCFWVGVYDCCRGASWKFPRGLYETFWIYCMHGAITGYFISGGYFVLGKTDGVSVALAVCSFIPTILVCVLFNNLCKRILPKLYALLMGGR